MLQNLLISFNIIFPIFILVLLGMWLRKKDVMDDTFVKKSNKLVYSYALPANMFYQIFLADFDSIQNVNYMLYAVICVALATLILSMIVPRLISNKKRCGAFIQNSFRSNFVLLGTVMATNLFGIEGAVSTILLIPSAVITLTICSIVVLTIFSSEIQKEKLNLNVILINIIKNPVIIGIAIGLLYKLTGLGLPGFLLDAIKSLSSIVTPLALLCLGAEIKLKKSNDIKQVLTCCMIKLVIIPIITMLPAIFLFNFTGYELGALFFIFCTPCGVTNYSLIYSMKSDYEFASQAIVLSSFLSFFTMMIGIFLLIEFGFFVV